MPYEYFDLTTIVLIIWALVYGYCSLVILSVYLCQNSYMRLLHIFIALFFLSFNSFSQNIDQIRSVANFSSESELVSYVEKAKLKGLNLIQVEKLALAQGAKP